MFAFLWACRKKRLFYFLVLLSSATPAISDTIYFKDGAITVCRERAWEQDDQVNCEFYGTVVTYPKKEVDRIETGKREIPGTLIQPVPKDSDAFADKTGNPASDPPEPPTKTPPVIDGIDRTGGDLFYDPRRPNKYWASETSRHDTLAGAVEALALQFNRSPEWVKANMGITNDLAQIHRNLSGVPKDAPVDLPSPPEGSAPASSDLAEARKMTGLKFYDPRRPRKYWATDTSFHETLSGALQALADAYGQSPEWVKSHMGGANDLGKIHENLAGQVPGAPASER